MPHARRPAFIRRAHRNTEATLSDWALVADRRTIANLFAAYDLTCCGRIACSRAQSCVGPDGICFVENRDYFIEAMHDLLASRPFVEGGKAPGAGAGEGDEA